MSYGNYLEIFTQYGADIAVLSIICAAVVQICKVTFLKNVPKKLITFAPFVAGIVIYAVYASAKNMDFFYIFSEFQEIAEQGFKIGTLATLLYVLYEQFVRGDVDDSPDGGSDNPDGIGDYPENTEETDGITEDSVNEEETANVDRLSENSGNEEEIVIDDLNDLIADNSDGIIPIETAS